MDSSIGKKFETRFAQDWKRCFPGTLIYRLPDQQSGYAGGGSANPCDFMCYPGNCVLMVECKAHAKASIPFSAIPQYERLLDYKGKYKTFPGVVVWFYEKDVVIWVSIEEMEKMVTDGEKSIGLRMIDEKKPYKKSYNIITLPSKKLRTFMETDYNYLVEVLNG
jgi:Holliday junction resolvase